MSTALAARAGASPGTSTLLRAATVLTVLLAGSSAVLAQSPAVIAPTDPVYADLERLEAFGLVPGGVSSQRPLSAGRLAWIAHEARAGLGALGGGLDVQVRADLLALLGRVETRLGVDDDGPLALLMEGELGGGRSPGAAFPDAEGYGIGTVEAVSNPLWAYRGGRSYGDRITGALAARAELGLGRSAALTLGGRVARWDASGPVGGRGEATVEAASLRVVLSNLAVDVGRGAVVWGRTNATPLLLSDNGVPLDMVRLSTDRPVSLHILGDVDVTAFVADLGPNQHFPHTKEIGIRLDLRPAGGLTLGFSALNKQGGEGAPTASLRRRLWDASVLGPAIFGDDGQPFSDKLMGVDLRWAFPSLRGLEITAAGALTDFEKLRFGDVLDAAGGYRAGLLLPRLGSSQRHSLALEGQRTGPYMYRHHQFRGGLATEYVLQGSALGPDARAAVARYAYHRPSAHLRLEVAGSLERRSADTWDSRYDPVRDVFKTADFPDQVRARLQTTLTFWVSGGAGVIRLHGAVDRVRNPSFPAAGPARTDAMVLVQFQRAF